MSPITTEYLSTADLAELLRTPEATIRFWRHEGTGPKGFKPGRRVLYKRTDVDAWIQDRYDSDTAA